MSSAVPPAPLIGWQTLLADLSLILFMVTAAAMASAPAPVAKTSVPTAPKPPMAAPRAEPLALWQAQCSARVSGRALDAGHFLAEERPEETAAALLDPLPVQPGGRVLRGTSAFGSARLRHPRARRYRAGDDDALFTSFRSCAA